MQDRGEKLPPKLSKETVAKISEMEFQKMSQNTQKPSSELTPELKNNIIQFKESFLVEQKDPRGVFVKSMMGMITSFRPVYQKRYEEWKKINNIKDKEDVAAGTLKSP